ncbi:MAG: PaaI family thioesterase [Acidobacteriota bacterium]
MDGASAGGLSPRDIPTHGAMDRSLSGTPVALGDGRATVELPTLDVMQADASGLVHGGFVFSLADHAAMLAVGHPNVVLGSAQCRFLRPAVVGETLVAEARLDRVDGKKHFVQVTVKRGDEAVFEGEMTCFVPPSHVLERKGQ